jgi:type IV secretion system protein VirB5
MESEGEKSMSEQVMTETLPTVAAGAVAAPRVTEGQAATRRRPNANADQLNPYLAARGAWDERYGDLIVRARNWRMACFAALLVALAAVGGLVVVSQQTRLVPFVVAVNELGRPVASGVATPERFKVDEPVVKAQIADFVSAWRGITTDWTFQREQIDKVFAHIGQGTPAQVAISDWYRADPPQQRGLQGTVQIDIQSVLKTGDKSFEVQWSETKRLATGQMQGKEEFRGIVTVAVNPPKSEAEGRVNPLGVYVTNATWAQLFTQEQK